MEYKTTWLVLLVALSYLLNSATPHEDIAYEDVQEICKTCVCLSTQNVDKRFHHIQNCAVKHFQHILARWPDEFGKNHDDIDLVAIFSGNSIKLLQQLPATNASLTFSCRHCEIRQLQTPTFMDVPNIKRLDLSWNELTSDELTPDAFRGPYRATHYEPIALEELELSHNLLHSLNKKLFEHTPNLRKLDLSHNRLRIIDNPTAMSLAVLTNLNELDLSYTELKVLPANFFKMLTNLVSLQLAGNQFAVPPDNLQPLGLSLEVLNIASNPIEQLSGQSFLGLKMLRRLNISDLPELTSIANSSFAPLRRLEHLECAYNPKLMLFDLDALLPCSNLTKLNISYCSINSVSLALSSSVASNATNVTIAKPWPKLRSLDVVGNPWHCDCELLKALELMGATHRYRDTEARCETPYIFAGARLSNLTANYICNVKISRKYLVMDEEDPPRFLRKRYIILTAITASVVVVVGLLIGFVVAYIRRRLKSEEFGVEPIRYTSVRSSNLSAFSHGNANGNANA